MVNASKGSVGLVGLTYGNGSASTYKSSTPMAVATGVERMIGFILDNSTPANVSFIIDGAVSTPSALTYDIDANTGYPITIGAVGAGGSKYAENICDVQIYPYALTDLQVKQLHENRMLAATEPAVLTTLT